MHAPYFFHALNDALKLAPAYFHVASPPTTLDDFVHVKPTWSDGDLVRASDKEGLSFMYFVASVWSFWDWYEANKVFARAMVIRGELGDSCTDEQIEALKTTSHFDKRVDQKRQQGLLNTGTVAELLPEKLRDVVARLFAFSCPIPKAGSAPASP